MQASCSGTDNTALPRHCAIRDPTITLHQKPSQLPFIAVNLPTKLCPACAMCHFPGAQTSGTGCPTGRQQQHAATRPGQAHRPSSRHPVLGLFKETVRDFVTQTRKQGIFFRKRSQAFSDDIFRGIFISFYLYRSAWGIYNRVQTKSGKVVNIWKENPLTSGSIGPP